MLRCDSISSQVSGSGAEGRPDLWPTWGGAGIGQLSHSLPEPGAEPGLVQRLGGKTERENPVFELMQEKQWDLLQLTMTDVWYYVIPESRVLLQKSWKCIWKVYMSEVRWVHSLSLIYALPDLDLVNDGDGKHLFLSLWWTLFSSVLQLYYTFVHWCHTPQTYQLFRISLPQLLTQI